MADTGGIPTRMEETEREARLVHLPQSTDDTSDHVRAAIFESVDEELARRLALEAEEDLVVANNISASSTTTADYAPLMFQFSTGITDDIKEEEEVSEETCRTSELQMLRNLELVAGIGQYTGGAPGMFNDTLKRFIEDNKDYPGVLLIVLNAHGDENGGLMSDRFGKESITWTPDMLWNGYRDFEGLGTLLRQYPRPRMIVCAQCFGSIFQRDLAPLLVTDDDGLTEVHSVADGETESQQASISTAPGAFKFRLHADLYKWMQNRGFGTAYAPSTDAPGVGARFRLATNELSRRQLCLYVAQLGKPFDEQHCEDDTEM